MLILYETATGYALFRVHDEDKLKIDDDTHLEKAVGSAGITSIVSLDTFVKFDDMPIAVREMQAINNNEMSDTLRKFLRVCVDKDDSLIVVDKSLGANIKETLDIDLQRPEYTLRLTRLIRQHLNELIPEIVPDEFHSMELGLSHNWSMLQIRYSPEKIDTMIIQAVSLLDDLYKEINTYAMRVKEWYGWHFPELAKLVEQNETYCQLVLAIGMRTNARDVSLSNYLEPQVEEEVKAAAVVSMGSEISPDDLQNIQNLCRETIEIIHYQEQLEAYLRQRMSAIAPNLSKLVGETVGARLISHTGSLINLAKSPGSTIQILGAEKALFRAIKAKKKTPKYGLIYHAALIGQAPAKSKGQISRVLAAKAALCARVDALAETTNTTIGDTGKQQVEKRLRELADRAQGVKAPVKMAAPVRQAKDIAVAAKTMSTHKDIKLTAIKQEPLTSVSSDSSDSSESDSSSESEEVIKKEVKHVKDQVKTATVEKVKPNDKKMVVEELEKTPEKPVKAVSSSESSESSSSDSSDSSSDSSESEENASRKRSSSGKLPAMKKKK